MALLQKGMYMYFLPENSCSEVPVLYAIEHFASSKSCQIIKLLLNKTQKGQR